MKKISIIITLLLMFLFCTSLQRTDTVRKVVIVEDVDLQFVNKWIKDYIVDCPRPDRKVFIEKLWNSKNMLLVVKQCRRYGYQPSVVFSQMFIESRHRSQSRVSDFVIATNNYFGIVYKNFKEVKTARYCTSTREFINSRTHKRYEKCYRSFSAFNNFEDCLTAYCTIVSRYRMNGDWNHWKRVMCKHYATNPQYLQMVNTVIKVNHLSEFDKYIRK